MYEWENRKRNQIQHSKLLKLQKDEAEKLQKVHRQEESYQQFKEWLKKSLLKQRENQIQKKIIRQDKKQKEEEKEKQDALRRVNANIAFKDWKLNKLAEEKLKKKREAIIRRQGKSFPLNLLLIKCSIQACMMRDRSLAKRTSNSKGTTVQEEELLRMQAQSILTRTKKEIRFLQEEEAKQI